MILPTDISPEKLNLAWGMHFDPARYESSGSDSTFDWAEIDLDVAGEKYSISLFFDAQGLGCITCVVLQSEWVSDYKEEKIEAISRNYTQMFRQMVIATNTLLGAPNLLVDECNEAEGEYISLPDNQGIMRIRTGITDDVFSKMSDLIPPIAGG